jgi:glutamate-1-semialdehyde aminotransferase
MKTNWLLGICLLTLSLNAQRTMNLDEAMQIALKNNLDLKIVGMDTLFKFYIQNAKNNNYLNFLTSEMLGRGFLATNALYISVSHSKKLINLYLKAIDQVFLKISKKFI